MVDKDTNTSRDNLTVDYESKLVQVVIPIEPHPCTKCWNWMTPFRWLTLNLTLFNFALATTMIVKLIKLLGRYKLCSKFCIVKSMQICTCSDD